MPARIDVVVNNAGGNTDFEQPDPHDLETLARNWRANLDANLLSAVLVTAAVRDRLAVGRWVVHIGSIAADKGAGSYGAAKAGLASWSVSLATELGPLGVTSNVVSPGYIEQTGFFRDRLTNERRTALIAATKNGRAGTVEEVAAAAHFLASPAARHITGQVINVNGGALTTR